MLRRVLVTGQFAASVTLAIFTLVVLAQFRFMRNQDLGIALEQTLVLKVNGTPHAATGSRLDYLQGELQKIPAVRNVSFSPAFPVRKLPPPGASKG